MFNSDLNYVSYYKQQTTTYYVVSMVENYISKHYIRLDNFSSVIFWKTFTEGQNLKGNLFA